MAALKIDDARLYIRRERFERFRAIPRKGRDPMAKNSSFDVSTGVDLQEVDNAVNQARKEVAQRYDFKELSRKKVETSRKQVIQLPFS